MAFLFVRARGGLVDYKRVKIASKQAIKQTTWLLFWGFCWFWTMNCNKKEPLHTSMALTQPTKYFDLVIAMWDFIGS